MEGLAVSYGLWRFVKVCLGSLRIRHWEMVERIRRWRVNGEMTFGRVFMFTLVGGARADVKSRGKSRALKESKPI